MNWRLNRERGGQKAIANFLPMRGVGVEPMHAHRQHADLPLDDIAPHASATQLLDAHIPQMALHTQR
jgi:hypothetical protein